ncbi:ADP-ribosylation factor-like protein 13B [Hyalella azteca]|uniref:ADP-ribosylation factor-like protein 13B n=1 Tax=Hyalella azteca TaxID=294128 RepID=A0A8B7P7V1_HYAAZ|nr:ADP-ribosylation factor-like protein 13B [Hyalella azteca]
MGNCLQRLGLFREKRPVTLLLVGLDNAGKTTAAKGILGEPLETVAPTLGFVPEVLQYRGCDVTLFDLGGAAKLRPVWTRYFAEVRQYVLVGSGLKPSATDRVDECRAALQELLAHRRIAGKPVLILANKQDVDGAMDEMDIVEMLDIETTVNKYKCPTRVETCSAIAISSNNKPDKPIADGFRWLLDTIVVHYAELQGRVEHDVEKERLRAQRKLEQVKERIRHRRAEEERLQQMSQQETVTADAEVEDEVVVVSGVTEGECGDEDSPPTRRPLARSPSEAQELHELGLPSNTSSLAALTSTSGEVSARENDDQNGNVDVSSQPDAVHAETVMAESPSLQVHRSDSGHYADNGSHRIIVVSSPSDLSHLTQTPAPLQNSSNSLPQNSLHSLPQNSSHSLPQNSSHSLPQNSHSLPQNSSHSLPQNLHSRPQLSPLAQPTHRLHDGLTLSVQLSPMRETLDLQTGDEDEGGDCVRIDSDDELFDMDERCSASAATAYVKDQLETSLSRHPKKKSFLRRYHKTGPAGVSPSKGLSIT